MRYACDLTDTEWKLIDYCFPKPFRTGRPEAQLPGIAQCDLLLDQDRLPAAQLLRAKLLS